MQTSTPKIPSVVGLYSSHRAAEAAVKQLKEWHFDSKKLSVFGHPTNEDHPHLFKEKSRPSAMEKEDNKFVLVVHGSATDASQAKEILSHTMPETLDDHASAPYKMDASVLGMGMD